MMTWDLMLESAKGNPKEMKELRQILKDNLQKQSWFVNRERIIHDW